MKPIKHTLIAGAVMAFAGILSAQSVVNTAPPENSGVGQGVMEFTIGGAGSSNRHLNDSLGGVNLSLGRYYTDTLEGLIRQSVNYSNSGAVGSGSVWSGATKLAVDEHFGTNVVRPFLGVNLGYVYGEAVNDTWAAGLEGGVKYYVHPRTFIAATLEYAWFFKNADSIDNRFDTGQFNWSVGLGFNF